jgi:hypothetical protein
MVRVSLTVGMSGAVAVNVMVDGPVLCQLPATAGVRVGVVHPLWIGADRVTVIFWSEGTSTAPLAGEEATTVSGLTEGDVAPE